jgi:hypothetical protein
LRFELFAAGVLAFSLACLVACLLACLLAFFLKFLLAFLLALLLALFLAYSPAFFLALWALPFAAPAFPGLSASGSAFGAVKPLDETNPVGALADVPAIPLLISPLLVSTVDSLAGSGGAGAASSCTCAGSSC